MKQEILNLMRATGAFAPFRVANCDKALILTYHRFSETGERDTTSRRSLCATTAVPEEALPASFRFPGSPANGERQALAETARRNRNR